jgi:hypothetical protein
MGNRFGLSRSIPADVKRQVRVRCGFGCAICGATITEYEHFYPDFKDAKGHDPDSIVLLCPSHHAEVTKGVIPKDAVSEASRQPAAKAAGFSHRESPWFKGDLAFKVGSLVTRGTPIPFCVKGEIPIFFTATEDGSSFTSISAGISGPDGRRILDVVQNEWRVSNETADFEWVGKRYIFRSADRVTVLQLRFDPPDLITIEKMMAVVGGSKFEATEDYLELDGRRFPMMEANYCGMGMMIG